MEEEAQASPSPSRRNEPSHLIVGRILAPHGLRGEVEVEILTDFPDRFGLLKMVYLGEELQPAVVEGHRFKNSRVILKLVDCEDRDEAGTLRGKLIHVPLDEAMPLEEEEYYVYQILGLDVWTTEGEFLGSVDDILFTGSNDVYVVRNDDQELLIPALSDVIMEVDINSGRIKVQLMEGLR